jgi:hypothetical protein
MAAVANNPKFAKKVGVPQSVGREFANADKRNKDMPSFYKSSAKKPGKAVKKGYAHGGRTAADRRANISLGNKPTRVSGGPGGLGRNQRQLYQRAVAGAGALGMKKGGKVHDKKVLRNLDDEDYRIRNRTGSNTDAERRRINREKTYERRHMAKGGKVQGYNARLDESLGARNKTKGEQSLKSRRKESEGMEKAAGKRKYQAVKKMSGGGKVGLAKNINGVAKRGLTRGWFV